jgi:hypothetical protein
MEDKPVESMAEFLAVALAGATGEGAIGVHVRNSFVLLTEERKSFDNVVYCHKLASWHIEEGCFMEAAEHRIHKEEEKRAAAQKAEADFRAEIGRLEWEDVRLRHGRVLTPVEQEKLIVLIDRFMDYRAINTGRYSEGGIDETACEIEELLTKAGWYPDMEEVSDGKRLR